MPNKNYRKGYVFELECLKDLRKQGWIVSRSAGSHSVYDLIAVKEGLIRGIQCKLGKYLKLEEKVKMKLNWCKHKILPIVATREKTEGQRKQKIKYTLVL